MLTVFFSYSHKDESYRDRLEVHLAPLKWQGIIGTWHDRRVDAGDEILNEISKSLERADIILLLVSADFIASAYCYEVEMGRAMELHEQGKARVIPVILRPCDWQEMPFGKLLAVPTDGRPISKFPNTDDAFLEVVQEIKRIGQKKGTTDLPQAQPPSRTIVTTATDVSDVRSSNLRIKKTFTDRDKDKFLTESFEYVANFFDNSLKELEKRQSEIDIEYRRVDANCFTAAIYLNGKNKSEFKVWIRGEGNFLSNGISYSRDRSISRNSTNGWLTLGDDGYHLFLQSSGMETYNRRDGTKENQLSQQGGAENLWDIFIEPLQR